MVPPLSALSLALCHEALEGGGYQQMGTIKYAKKSLPLLLTPFAIHCLTKATAFVPQCENGGFRGEVSVGWNQTLKTVMSQKETSPLAHSVRNSLPHKSLRFCSPMRKRWFPSCGVHYMQMARFARHLHGTFYGVHYMQMARFTRHLHGTSYGVHLVVSTP